MSDFQGITILCLATDCKGQDLVRELHRLGCRVLVITEEKKAEADWAYDSIHERFLMPNLSMKQDVIHAVSYLARRHQLSAILPLDDYDVEMAAALREHLRLGGMGDSQARFFRDKLAMRAQAHARGVPVPAFSGIFSYDDLRAFMQQTPPPWVLKPRSEAGAIGIRKLSESEQVWRALDELGDKQSFYLLEQFVPGDIYHVDSIIADGTIHFSPAHKYARPPLTVSHEGGVFSTRTLPRDGDEYGRLQQINQDLLTAFGMRQGVTHAEFIRGDADGQYYFLEIGGRVGGANIADVIEHASGINLWREWARLVVAGLRGERYVLPATRERYAGSVICLAQQQWPDLSAYNDPEVVWRLNKEYHAGLIVASPDSERVEGLLRRYIERFSEDFLAIGRLKDAKRTYSG